MMTKCFNLVEEETIPKPKFQQPMYIKQRYNRHLIKKSRIKYKKAYFLEMHFQNY